MIYAHLSQFLVLWCGFTLLITSLALGQSYTIAPVHVKQPCVLCKHRSHEPAGTRDIPDSKVHGANMRPTWVLSTPGGPHVGPMNLAIWALNMTKHRESVWIYHGMYGTTRDECLCFLKLWCRVVSKIKHYTDFAWAPWRLKSQTAWQCVQQYIHEFFHKQQRRHWCSKLLGFLWGYPWISVTTGQ